MYPNEETVSRARLCRIEILQMLRDRENPAERREVFYYNEIRKMKDYLKKKTQMSPEN